MIGATIDNRYRILRRLGEGGMGAVFEAEHTGTRRRVAVKVIHTEKAQKPDMVARFQREARAVGSLDTPHIVQVLDTGTDATSAVIYTVMELLRGEDLRQVLARVRRLPPRVAMRLAGQVCVGLAEAHGAGVIHRDIKPANVFLCQKESGEVSVKIVDFGIAKIKADVSAQEDLALTTTGGMIGSPLYMSPEQAMGAKSIDHRSDLWSLGVVLYEALAGRLPHLSETLGSLIVAISTKDAPPLQDLAPWVPPEMARLTHRLLEREPSARFPSAAAVLEAIQAIVPDGLTVRTSEITPLSDEELAEIAPRAVLDLDTEARSKLALTGTLELPPSEVSTGPRLRSPVNAGHAASGENGLAVSQLAAPPRARTLRSPLVPVLGLCAALGVAGLVAYLLQPPSASSAPSQAAPAATAPAAVEPPVPATTAAPIPPAAERTVRIPIEPTEAAVEVNGRATPVKDGHVELRGSLGSIHRVRIVLGSQDVTQTVVLTEEGPLPPSLRVAPPAASASDRPVVGKLPPPPRPPPPPQPPSSPTAGGTATAVKPQNLPPAATFE